MTRRLPALACIVLAVCGVVAAAVVADDQGKDDAVVVAAEGSDVPTTLGPATTTTEVTVPTTVTLPVTVPTVTLPLQARTPTTTAAPGAPVTTVPAPPAGPKPQGGARCGTPSGYAGLGADRTATEGRLTVTLQVYSCEVYDGEQLQNAVMVDAGDSVLRSVRVDYGDGDARDIGVYPWQCQEPDKPRPYYANGSPHPYAAPGAYEVVATVVTAACDTGGEQSATVRMTVYRIAGKRPS